MACLSQDAKKGFRVLFVNVARVRKTIYLGKVTRKTADSILCRVEQLIEAQVTGQAKSLDLANWVNSLDLKLRKKFVAVGLLEPTPEENAHRLDAFLADHIESKRSDFKPATIVHLEQVAGKLKRFYGGERDICSINADDAQRFRGWLKTEGLSDTSIARRLQTCRAFFNHAIEQRIVTENPFAACRQRNGNPLDKRDYVPTESVLKLIGHAPDRYWRLLLVLSRFAGLRVPSEALSLKWEHIDWTVSCITVPSPKTEHHAGQGSRLFPLLPSIRPYLEDVYSSRDEGEYVFPRKLRDRALGPAAWANCNLRTQLERIIRGSGLKPWSRLWHSMRASCQTDLIQQHPIPVVCRWLGNSVAVAMRHYVDVSDSDFRKAIDRDPYATSAQIPTQYNAVTHENNTQVEQPKEGKDALFPVFSKARNSLHPTKVGGTRLELDTKSSENIGSVESERTESDAQNEPSGQNDTALRSRVVDEWDSISDEVKRYLTTMLQHERKEERVTS